MSSCKGEGFRKSEIDLVQPAVDVIVFKEEHFDEPNNIVQDILVFEERIIEEFRSPETSCSEDKVGNQKRVRKCTSGKIEAGPGIWKNDIGPPDAKRRRIACAKTVVISNA